MRKFLGKDGAKYRELMTPMSGNTRKTKKFSDDAVDAIAIAICHILKLVAK